MNSAQQPTIQDAMCNILLALGFDAMAIAVKSEQDEDKLRRYAKVCVKNSPESARPRMIELFRSSELY